MEKEPPEIQQSQQADSLIKRLAGPSTGKAGLAKDQTEINRIIAEASRGSKFYENEKKKDQDVTERISRILKLRDSLMKGADTSKIEHGADLLLAELESRRDLSQCVVHFDMDAFFANVELLHNPELKDKPFCVGGGVVSTASYEARKYGVRSGMAGFIAKKLCPELIFVKSHYDWYSDMSNKVFSVLSRYDPNLCAAGCDEGYLNITPYLNEHNIGPQECVKEIRETVFAETKLTISAGIAPNKMLAKICSDKNKPNGQFYLSFESKAIIEFMHDLPIRKIPGIGRVNERLLESIGIKICGDIYTHRATISLLDRYFGLKFLLRTYLGIASNVVQPYQREERKSIGAERTFQAIGSKELILKKLEDIAAELEDDMERYGWAGRTVTLKYKLDTYQVFSRAKSFERWITKKEDLYTAGKELLLPELPLKIRLIGLRVTKLKDLKSSSDPTVGIKRFFEPNTISPEKKRRRLSSASNDIDCPEDEDDSDRDDDSDVMPDFHDYSSHQPSNDHLNDIEVDAAKQSKSYTPSTTSRLLPSFASPSTKQQTLVFKPQNVVGSSSTPKTPIKSVDNSLPPSSEIHTCPVCEKNLTTDNQGLNEHIDFCLSRSAIREAQAEANKVTPPKKGSGNGTEGATSRPESRSKKFTSSKR